MPNPENKESLALQPAASSALSYGADYATAGRVHLWDYWQAVRKHLWLVLGLTLLATALATVYLLRKPNIYEAQALVQVDLEDLNPALGAAAKNNSVVLNNAINDPAYFNTQLRILSSAALLRRAIKTLDLENNKSFLPATGGPLWWRRLKAWAGVEQPLKEQPDEPPAPANSPTAAQDLAEAERLAPHIKELRRELQIAPVIERRLGYARDNTRLIEISYTHRDPVLAAKAVNGIADAFVLFNLERKAETNVSTGDFLHKRIAELQSQIRGGEERLINYARNHQILSLNADQNTVVERLVGLNKQLLEAENRRKLAEASYQAARAPGAAAALAEEHTARQITEMETRLAEARQRYAQLLVENTEEWPEVKEVNQQISALEQEINRVRLRSTTMTLRNFETQYRQALAAETALRAAFDQQRGETLAQNEAAINYRIIQQEIETNKNLLDGLLQRYKENDVALAGLRNNIHVIDYAVTPDKAVGPRRAQGVALVLLFSLVFSAGLAVLLEYLNNTVATAEEVERLLQLPVLVAIPVSSGGLRLNQKHPELLFEQTAGSPLAEAYRQLRTAVLLSTPGHAPQTLLITSSLPSEGKTTTAVNLALCLAQTKAPVLLIDADLRRPRLRSLFQLETRTGLSTYLSSEMSEAALLKMIERHDGTSLHLLGSGPVPPNPAELLSSEQMRRLLKTLSAHFAYIIIDSPPAASFTDGVLLASLMDGTLLVAHSGKTPRAALRRTQQLLSSAGAKLLGVVLNQVEARQHDYYYQGYYRYVAEQGGLDDLEVETAFTPPSTTLALPPAPAEVTAEPASEEAFQRLCAAFNEPPSQRHEAAARALYELGDEHFARAWRAASPAGRRRLGAAFAASGLAQETINQLAASNNGHGYDALALLMLLLQAGEFEPLLRAIEEHPDLGVRIALVRLISLRRQAEIIPALRRLALNDELPPEVHSALLAAIYPTCGVQEG